MLADAGYYNAAEVRLRVEHGIMPYLPKADTSANTQEGLYGKSPFKYDETKDVYMCPAGAALTYRFGYTHFLLKGLEKVRCEWSLTTLAYNLKRVLNLVSFEKLMQAVGVKVPQRA